MGLQSTVCCQNTNDNIHYDIKYTTVLSHVRSENRFIFDGTQREMALTGKHLRPIYVYRLRHRKFKIFCTLI